MEAPRRKFVRKQPTNLPKQGEGGKGHRDIVLEPIAKVIVANKKAGGRKRCQGYSDVACDRQTILGNPFPMGPDGHDERYREAVCEAHSVCLQEILSQPQAPRINVMSLSCHHALSHRCSTWMSTGSLPSETSPWTRDSQPWTEGRLQQSCMAWQAEWSRGKGFASCVGAIQNGVMAAQSPRRYCSW